MLNRDILKGKAYRLREDNGYSWEKIGSFLGVSRRTAKRLYEEAEILAIKGSNKYPQIEENDIEIARFKPFHVVGDAVVSCDWHIPLHSTFMVNRLLEKASEMDIPKLIIAGDFFNMDTFSHYLPHQHEASFQYEKTEGLKIMDACLEVFDEIIFTWGNHDFRMVKFLNHVLDFEYCMRWLFEPLGAEKLSRLKISQLDHLVYHPGYYDLYVCHPENFSARPLTVARDLVPKYGMGVLTAHSHHFAQGIALDGENPIFDGGGLFSPERTEYIKRSNRHHKWVQGFYIWKNGICHSFSPAYHNL